MIKAKIISTEQICFIDAALNLMPTQEVLVEVENVIEPAIVLCDKNCPKAKPQNEEEIPEVKFLRLLEEKDETFKNELKKIAKEYLTEAKNKVFRHELEMKILGADLSFDQKKITFYFTATSRVDFRGLVADMAGDFNKIIRLQQVGPRSEAKLFGGFGKCGRGLCCSNFLNNLETINLEMTNISDERAVRPAMYTGCCGKLMCCLSFEEKMSPSKTSKEKSKSVKTAIAAENKKG